MNIKMILKGLLLYVTTLVTILTVTGIDSLFDAGYAIQCVLVSACLIYVCCTAITEEEFKTLTLTKWLESFEEE